MGISSFPGAADGVLPVLVMNTVLSVALLKNSLRFLLQIVGSDWNPLDVEENPVEFRRERRISIIKFRPSSFSGGSPAAECSVCLSGFEEEEEVSELDCSHFFHTRCLDKWFENKHRTCPLCRSVILFH